MMMEKAKGSIALTKYTIIQFSLYITCKKKLLRNKFSEKIEYINVLNSFYLFFTIGIINGGNQLYPTSQ